MASFDEMMRDPNTRVTEEPMRVDIPLPAPTMPAASGAAPVCENPLAPAFKNIEMEQMIAALEKHLERTDKIGYAAARNTRILRSETQEYFERREYLVNKYGEPQVDEQGNQTGLTELRFDSPNFALYAAEIEEWALIEHHPCLYQIPSEEVIGKLSGTEILEIDWMLKD